MGYIIAYHNIFLAIFPIFLVSFSFPPKTLLLLFNNLRKKLLNNNNNVFGGKENETKKIGKIAKKIL